MSNLTVTLLQSNPFWEQIDANLAMYEHQLTAVDADTDLIVLPEMFSTGFSMNASNLAESMNGKTVAWMKQKAIETNAALIGSLIIEENNHYYNRMVFVQPDGNLVAYDKKHLFAFAGEDKVYTAGKTHADIVLHQWHIRPFICYDLRFPIWTRNLNLAYDLAIFTANWPAPRASHWRTLLRARAIENQVYAIGVNRMGQDGNGLAYAGQSAVIAPTGEVIFEAASEQEVNTVTLDRNLLDQFRKEFPVWEDGDGDMIKN